MVTQSSTTATAPEAQHPVPRWQGTVAAVSAAEIKVRVVLYDPLADPDAVALPDGDSLYGAWGFQTADANSPDGYVETAAYEIAFQMTLRPNGAPYATRPLTRASPNPPNPPNPAQGPNAGMILDEGGLEVGSDVFVEFPEFLLVKPITRLPDPIPGNPKHTKPLPDAYLLHERKNERSLPVVSVHREDGNARAEVLPARGPGGAAVRLKIIDPTTPVPQESTDALLGPFEWPPQPIPPVATVPAPGGTPPPTNPHALRLAVGASYKIRIWLRPRAIVLHWSAGGNQVGPIDHASRSYHFRVTARPGAIATLRPGHPEAQRAGSPPDPRFWRHNLFISGVPRVYGVAPGNPPVLPPAPPEIPGVPVHFVPTGTQLGRGYYFLRPDFQHMNGYAAHAAKFNYNTVGVNMCGMAHSNQGWPNNPHLGQIATPILPDQIRLCVECVAELCRAWRLDPRDPKQLCTHFEVEYLHCGLYNRTGGQRKFDVTWLPGEYQTEYAVPMAKIDLISLEWYRLRHDAQPEALRLITHRRPDANPDEVRVEHPLGDLSAHGTPMPIDKSYYYRGAGIQVELRNASNVRIGELQTIDEATTNRRLFKEFRNAEVLYKVLYEVVTVRRTDLCAPAGDPLMHKFTVDVDIDPVFGRFTCQDGTKSHHGHATVSPSNVAGAVTDRVGAYLRELVANEVARRR